MQLSNPISPDLEKLTDEVCQRLAQNKRVRRFLPDGGRLHIDRQLPFLCVFRLAEAEDSGGTEQLVTAEASYMLAPAAPQWRDMISRLCRRLGETLQESYGTFLLIEVWESPPEQPCSASDRPGFQIVTSDASALPTCLETLQQALAEIRLGPHQAKVQRAEVEEVAAPGLPPLLTAAECHEQGWFRIGIAIEPVHRDPSSAQVYPVLRRRLRRQFSRALQRTFCAFAGLTSVEPPEHYQMLGRREVVRAVGSSDERLVQIASAFDFLLLVTPKNADTAWKEFFEQKCKQEPVFFYRPLPFDPDLLKRELYELPLEQIEDPTLALLLRQRRDELDVQISMLRDRNTSRFLYGSLQLYGRVSDELLQTAQQLLRKLAAEDKQTSEQLLDAAAFYQLAQDEIDYYRGLYEPFTATIELRDDIAAGAMVSDGRLLIDRRLTVSPRRARALLHHEIGTHLLTYFNGKAQPLKQLSKGLAGYEPLQEGLAVLAEYAVGGLSGARLRVLAARVIACHALAEGASFMETFHLLHRDHGLLPGAAFTVALRVHRGGGLTKDAIYLRGLQDLLDYLQRGHHLEPLFVGKIALQHVPYVQELRRREIVQPPPLRPRYLDEPGAIERLARCQNMSLLDLPENLP